MSLQKLIQSIEREAQAEADQIITQAQGAAQQIRPIARGNDRADPGGDSACHSASRPCRTSKRSASQS